MKRSNKLMVLLLALTLIVGLLCVPVSAANGVKGDEVTLTFKIEDVYGADGTINVPAGIFSKYTVTSDAADSVSNTKFIFASAVKTTFVLKVTGTISSSASLNKVSEITISYNTYGADGYQTNSRPVTQTQSVKVVAATDGTVDLSELKEEIALAEALVEGNYTPDSWDVLDRALRAAKIQLQGDSQERIDAAALTLRNARLALVAIDYSDLLAALAEADEYLDSTAIGVAAKRLMTAIENAKALLEGGDPTSVEAAAAEVRAAAEALEAAIAENVIVVEKIVEKEVEVEVPVEIIKEIEVEVEKIVEVPVEPDDFCSKGAHPVWLILLIISAIINVVLVVLAVLYFIKKKNNQKDTTPLVDYRIEDDDK